MPSIATRKGDRYLILIFLVEILWLKLVVSRSIVKKDDERRVLVGYLSDTRSIPMIALNCLSCVLLLVFIR